jgi:hypothetical protein
MTKYCKCIELTDDQEKLLKTIEAFGKEGVPTVSVMLKDSDVQDALFLFKHGMIIRAAMIHPAGTSGVVSAIIATTENYMEVK